QPSAIAEKARADRSDRDIARRERSTSSLASSPGTAPIRACDGVRGGGLEPPQLCSRQPLKLVRLPIPPSSLATAGYRRGRRRCQLPRWPSVGYTARVRLAPTPRAPRLTRSLIIAAFYGALAAVALVWGALRGQGLYRLPHSSTARLAMSPFI